MSDELHNASQIPPPRENTTFDNVDQEGVVMDLPTLRDFHEQRQQLADALKRAAAAEAKLGVAVEFVGCVEEMLRKEYWQNSGVRAVAQRKAKEILDAYAVAMKGPA